MEMSVQLHDPVALLPKKEPRYTFDRRMGGPQSRSGRGGEDKNLIAPLGNRTSGLNVLLQFSKMIHLSKNTYET